MEDKMSKNKHKEDNRNIYKLGEANKTMKTTLDIPDNINKMLKYEKLKRNNGTIKDTIIDILNEYYLEWSKQNGK